MLLYRTIFALGAASVAQAANSWIVPGAAWMSTSNTKIDAHGGMVYKQGNTFYWVGQSASHSTFIPFSCLQSNFLAPYRCYSLAMNTY
jgi:hypothetical protein